MYAYTKEYAQKYIEGTLSSPYTIYKNRTIAGILHDQNVHQVWDLGGNVSGMMRLEGSLRYQLERHGLQYGAVDLVPDYFSPTFARSLGQPDSALYPSSLGIVGDLRQLPLPANTAEAIVCADVIEHIDQPEQAMSEIYRVLQPGGKAVLVVPSLYKLDSIRLPHILQKRFSSHENRLLVNEWVELFTQAGLHVNTAASRPLGVASGLLYLSWLNPAYVPSKPDEHSPETFSPQADAFRTVKKIVGRVDDRIDAYLMDHPAELQRGRQAFQNGDVVQVLHLIHEWYQTVTATVSPELTEFIETFAYGALSLEGLDELTQVVQHSNEAIEDNAFLGNSALLVLEKPLVTR